MNNQALSLSADFTGDNLGQAIGGQWLPYPYPYQPFLPLVEHHYIQSYPFWVENPNKIEQSFKIIQKLMEKKIVSIAKVKDFIELVNDISAIL